MRCAIVGNVAENAFLLADGLRRLGIEADSYDQGGGYPLQTPYWQRLDFDPTQERISAESEVWDWAQRAKRYGWQRPGWARILGNDGAEAAYVTQEDFEADLGRVIRGMRELAPDEAQRRDLAAALRASRTPPAAHKDAIAAASRMDNWRSVLTVASRYDLVVLCGMYAAFGALLPREQAYIAFEHGTLRYVPGVATPAHRLMALAHKQADATVITNADCWEAAGMLGIRDRSVFIPHPLDEAQFSPGDPREVARLREYVRRERCPGAELVFLAPARISRSEATGSKRNDRIAAAYARYVHEAEPAGAPRAALLMAAWGHPEHVREMEPLLDSLGIADRVAWLPCLPKARLLRWYRAADVVLDQFSETVGSFGAVTAEALAVGRPVITYYSQEAHSWAGCREALPARPPVLSCRTTDEIYETLDTLARYPAYREQVGAASREWVERWHGLERICKLHIALYDRVLRDRRAAKAWDGGASAPRVVETDCGPVGIGARETVEAAAG